jgi:hypothetical protein
VSDDDDEWFPSSHAVRLRDVEATADAEAGFGFLSPGCRPQPSGELKGQLDRPARPWTVAGHRPPAVQPCLGLVVLQGIEPY